MISLDVKTESIFSLTKTFAFRKELEIDIEPIIKPKPKSKIISTINSSLNKKKLKKENISSNEFKSFSGKGNKLGSNKY